MLFTSTFKDFFDTRKIWKSVLRWVWGWRRRSPLWPGNCTGNMGSLSDLCSPNCPHDPPEPAAHHLSRDWVRAHTHTHTRNACTCVQDCTFVLRVCVCVCVYVGMCSRYAIGTEVHCACTIFLRVTLYTRPTYKLFMIFFSGSFHDVVHCLIPNLSQVVVMSKY